MNVTLVDYDPFPAVLCPPSLFLRVFQLDYFGWVFFFPLTVILPPCGEIDCLTGSLDFYPHPRPGSFRTEPLGFWLSLTNFPLILLPRTATTFFLFFQFFCILSLTPLATPRCIFICLIRTVPDDFLPPPIVPFYNDCKMIPFYKTVISMGAFTGFSLSTSALNLIHDVWYLIIILTLPMIPIFFFGPSLRNPLRS